MLTSPALRFVKPSYMPKLVPSANCVLYYPMQDDPQSSTVRDRSGYGNNGAITGATWKRTGQGLWYLDFDGTDDVVNCGSDPSIDTGLATYVTLEGWMYPEGLGEANAGHIISSDDGTYWRIFLLGAYKIRFEVTDDSPLGHITDSNASSTPQNTWTHFGCTYDGATQFICINGVTQTDTAAWVDGLLNNAAAIVRVGDISTSDRCFNGGLALLRILNVGRTAAQFLVDYNQERHLFGV